MWLIISKKTIFHRFLMERVTSVIASWVRCWRVSFVAILDETYCIIMYNIDTVDCKDKKTMNEHWISCSLSVTCDHLSIYLRVYSLHHNVLPTLQSSPWMTNGPLYPITQDSSCHGQHTMPRSSWSFPWPVPHSCVCMNVCVAVAEIVRSSFVAVVSGIYYSDHWWLQAYL